MVFQHPLATVAVITLTAYSLAGWAIWKRASRAGGNT